MAFSFIISSHVWSYGFRFEANKTGRILVDSNGKRYLMASPAETKVNVDGKLDDTAWQNALFQGDFIQREPEEGEPATERTEIGVLFDKDNIYFGIKCYDSEPDRIIAKEMRRDAEMRNDDRFSLILDTYYDRRSGFYFTTNPHGSKRDAVMANEGRQYNSAWDGIWICRAGINEEGWFAEIAIPWKTLRFAEKDSSIWGVNFSRTIRRKNEEVFWQLVPRNLGFFGLFRISEAGTLKGMTHLKMGGNLELKPYFLGGLERDLNTEFQTDRMNDIGLDAKVAITPNLALDLTLNTDFAQVEADREQVNLTRFSLYYPEKREFFLEGAEVFAFGQSGGMRRGREGGGFNLFYSRRIGIVDGQEARILGGAKMVGKIGQYYVGVLNMLTDDLTYVVEEEDDVVVVDSTVTVDKMNFTVLRVRRDVFERGSIGIMFLNKEELNSSHYNQSFGIDAYFPITDYFTVSSSFAGSFEPYEETTDGKVNKNYAGTLGLSYSSDLWRFSLSHENMGVGFNPELGYVRRIDYRYSNMSLNYSPRPKNASVIRQFTYSLRGNYRTDHQNRMLDSELGASFTVRFQNSSRLTIGFQRENEYLDEAWEVREGFLMPEDTYSGYDVYLRANSDESRDLSGQVNVNYGDYYTGKNLRLGFESSITSISRLKLDMNYNHNLVDLPEGSFHTNTFGLRMYYYFSTEFYFKAYVQLNDDKLTYEGREKVVSNFLLRWIYSPGSDLFLVYNDGRMIGPGQDEISNRTVMVKATFFWRK